MTADDFRAIALSFPETVESSHMNHPDFRVGGKIFATLGYPGSEWGMVSLPPEEQTRVQKAEPEVFMPAKGAWGRAGATQVLLTKARKKTVSAAIEVAWQNRVAKTALARQKKASKKAPLRQAS